MKRYNLFEGPVPGTLKFYQMMENEDGKYVEYEDVVNIMRTIMCPKSLVSEVEKYIKDYKRE